MIQHFEKNIHGRDFVVGDIHGCFTLLEKELAKLNFDKNRDRLFSVGDLVDRGPESDMADHYILREKWFHAVRGNHDQMVVDAVADANPDAAGLHYINGGSWLYGLPEVEQQCIALVMKELPLAIEVETDQGLVGIIHAEVPVNDWDLFKQLYEANTDRFEAVALWSRDRIYKKRNDPVKGIDRVYVGHTVVKEISQFGNVFYIDTGAVFGHNLSIVQIQ